MLGIQIWILFRMLFGLPDPDPLVRGIGIRILPFSHEGVERLKDWLQNKILTENFYRKF